MERDINKIGSLFEDNADYSSIQVDEELHSEINETLDSLTDNNGGPLLLVRPPRENEGMDASISIYETLHNPREKKVGFGPFSAVQNKAHAHAHEIWYHNAQIQFFMRPETRVDANKLRRQIRSNYPNVDISEAGTRFPGFEVGEYISVAEIGLKRDFYFPIKSKLHNDDNFALDPYGDITSDMVVEEDETSDGQRVEAKDCKLVVQTVFEAARDVWNKSRPYGMDVNEIAQGMKEGEVHGNMLKGFDVRNPSTLRKKAAKILETLQGAKGYYITMRIIAISPYEEIAQRRCRNVSQDFETYYNSITQQGLTPIELTEEEMRESIVEAVQREHTLGFRDRFMSTGKFLQPVEALGAIAHIPNEDINTPVIDWAKQDTGPGTPSGGSQLEDEERQQQQEDESGIGSQKNTTPEPPEPKTPELEREQTVAGSNPTDIEGVAEPTDVEAERATGQEAAGTSNVPDGWDLPEAEETNGGGKDVLSEGERSNSTIDGWGDESNSEPNEQDIPSGGQNPSEEGGWADVEPESESSANSGWADSSTNEDDSERSTPAFASGNYDDGWGDESDSDDDRPGRR